MSLIGTLRTWRDVRLESVILGREAVEAGFRHLGTTKLEFTREGDDRLIGAFALDQIGTHCLIVLDRTLDAGGDDHRTGLSADFVQRHHLLVEMIDYDLSLEADRMVVAFDVTAELLGGTLRVEFRVGLYSL